MSTAPKTGRVQSTFLTSSNTIKQWLRLRAISSLKWISQIAWPQLTTQLNRVLCQASHWRAIREEWWRTKTVPSRMELDSVLKIGWRGSSKCMLSKDRRAALSRRFNRNSNWSFNLCKDRWTLPLSRPNLNAGYRLKKIRWNSLKHMNWRWRLFKLLSAKPPPSEGSVVRMVGNKPQIKKITNRTMFRQINLTPRLAAN